MNPTNKAIGANGCKLITGTSLNNINAFALVTNEETVISVLTFKDGSNALTALNISGQTLGANTYIPAGDAKESFATITLTSGSIWAY